MNNLLVIGYSYQVTEVYHCVTDRLHIVSNAIVESTVQLCFSLRLLTLIVCFIGGITVLPNQVLGGRSGSGSTS